MLSVILLVVMLWMLSAALLVLHYLNPRIGFAPLLITIGILVAFIQRQLGVYVAPAPGFIIMTSSGILVPVVLMMVLVLYVAHGSAAARLTIYGILAASAFTLAIIVLYHEALRLPNIGTISGITPGLLLPLDLRHTLASLGAFAADLFVIIIVYQGVRNYVYHLPEFVAVGIALLAALWTDAIVFPVLADLGELDFFTQLPGDLVGKTAAALALWPLVGFYLTRFAPRLPTYVGADGRGVFDVFRESSSALKMALDTTEAALARERSALLSEREKVRLLRDFISEASHDLRTPLTAMNLKLHQLAQTEDPDKRRRQIRELEGLSMRIASMIDDLLTLTRLDNIDRSTFVRLDVNSLLRQVLTSCGALFEDKQIDLLLDLAPTPLEVDADADDLGRALTNLVVNAARYTSQGGRVLVITRSQGSRVSVQVRDTGIGIAPDDLPRIFDRFFRAANAQAVDPSGTGLGLVIVRKIIDQHYGTIEVESTLNEGTKFTVLLPLAGTIRKLNAV